MAKSARTQALESLIKDLVSFFLRVSESYRSFGGEEAARAAHWAAGDLEWYLYDLKPSRLEDFKKDIWDLLQRVYAMGEEHAKYLLSQEEKAAVASLDEAAAEDPELLY